jgi:hypothetical protein
MASKLASFPVTIPMARRVITIGPCCLSLRWRYRYVVSEALIIATPRMSVMGDESKDIRHL